MRKLLLLIIILISFSAKSQEKGKIIYGLVTIDSITIHDVHIINSNTKTGTISNDNGIFEIPVKLGDTLFFSHINLENKTIVISEKKHKNE